MAIGYPGYFGTQFCLFTYAFVNCYIFKLSYPNVCAIRDQTSLDDIEKITVLHRKTMFYMYLSCSILALLIASLSWYFNKYYLPKDFASLGRIMSFVGALLRISLPILRFIHYCLLFVILYFVYKVYSISKCLHEFDLSIYNALQGYCVQWLGMWLI